MAGMDGFMRALSLMSGEAGQSQQDVQSQAIQQQAIPGTQHSIAGLNGEEKTFLIGLSAPSSPPVNWITETVNGEQVSYDPLLFRRGTGGDRAAKALVYCGPPLGVVYQPIGLSDYSYMFSKTNITKVNLERWEMAGAKNIEGMFSTCMSLTDLLVDTWKVGKCRNMSRMIENCLSLNVLKMSKWEPDNLEDIDDMFKAVDPALIPDWYDDWC